MKTVKSVCHECRGTGIFVGVFKPEGFGVVCLTCNGRGRREPTYTPFHARAHRPRVRGIFRSGKADTTSGVSYEELKQGTLP